MTVSSLVKPNFILTRSLRSTTTERLLALSKQLEVLQKRISANKKIKANELLELKIRASRLSRFDKINDKVLEILKNKKEIKVMKKENKANPEMLNHLVLSDTKLDKNLDKVLRVFLEDLYEKRTINDQCNVIVEFASGVGGEEAAIFTKEIIEMYKIFFRNKNWKCKTVFYKLFGEKGVREALLMVSGKDVYSRMKFESGVHRVQRVPTTSPKSCIQTSAAKIVVMPDISEEKTEIKPSDLKFQTYRASKKGGQHVNKTESAVRLIYKPLNIIVEVQSERCQHQNRASAMSILQSKLRVLGIKNLKDRVRNKRETLKTIGDRSEKIRTYNFPRMNVKDHRLKGKTFELGTFMMADDFDTIFEGLKEKDFEHYVKDFKVD